MRFMRGYLTGSDAFRREVLGSWRSRLTSPGKMTHLMIATEAISMNWKAVLSMMPHKCLKTRVSLH